MQNFPLNINDSLIISGERNEHSFRDIHIAHFAHGAIVKETELPGGHLDIDNHCRQDALSNEIRQGGRSLGSLHGK